MKPASRITRHATEILRKNPVLIIPAVLRTLLNQALFFLLLYPIISNMDQARLLLYLAQANPIEPSSSLILFMSAGLSIMLLSDSLFDSLLLGMIREAWRRGHTTLKTAHISNNFLRMLGAKLVRYIILFGILAVSPFPVLLLVHGAILPGALFGVALAILFLFSLFSLYWIKESVVADSGGVLQAVRNSYKMTLKTPLLCSI